MAASGVATTTRSPSSAASSTEQARAIGPSWAARSLRVSGPRELLRITECPAATLSRATVPPILPLPINPTVAIVAMISLRPPAVPGRGAGGPGGGLGRADLLVADVLVDHAGADVGDLRALGEPVDDEGVQVLIAGHGHVDEEVLVPGDHEHTEGLGQAADPVPEPLDVGPGRGPDAHRDQRLHRPAELGQVHVEAGAAGHPPLAQAAGAGPRGGRGHPPRGGGGP